MYKHIFAYLTIAFVWEIRGDRQVFEAAAAVAAAAVYLSSVAMFAAISQLISFYKITKSKRGEQFIFHSANSKFDSDSDSDSHSSRSQNNSLEK